MNTAQFQPWIDAATAGFTEAGFVRARGWVDQRDGMVLLSARADCPCGLGTSGISRMWPEGMAPPAARIHDEFKARALEHIEHDKAAGRWA
jgi:hypothetical protein